MIRMVTRKLLNVTLVMHTAAAYSFIYPTVLHMKFEIAYRYLYFKRLHPLEFTKFSIVMYGAVQASSRDIENA